MPIPVITVAQMREWEKATWASGQNELTVMRQAGRAVARAAERMTQPQDLILVFSGKGHNGEDAKYAAEELRDRRVEARTVLDPGATMAALPELLKCSPKLIIDGLFGIGLNRPLSANWIQLIQRLNQTGVPILSVDVPSGVNADTGLPLNDAIHAATTLTMGAVKQGLLKAHAWPFVGRLEAATDIGLIPYPFTTEIALQSTQDFAGFPPRRSVESHKGTFGHVAIVAGSAGYHGAAVLASRGAQRAHPGLITLLTTEEAYVPIASQCEAVMVRKWTHGLPPGWTAVLCGPGLAGTDAPQELKAAVRELWQKSSLPIIVDATALEWLPPGSCPPDAIRVITPHPGEASRLLGTSPMAVQNDRVRSLRDLSSRFGDAYVVLKGHQTLIGRAKEELFVNCSGNPLLAQGGSGDLLAGYIAGLLAQPGLQKDPRSAIRFAVWQHGAAADKLSRTTPNWTVEDLSVALGNADIPSVG